MLESAREFREDLMILGEREYAIKITQNLLREHMSIKFIKNVTGLSKKEIKKIRKAMEAKAEDQDL